MFWIFSLTIHYRPLHLSFGFNLESNFASLLVFTKVYEVIAWVLGVVQTALTRKFEYQADQFAADEFRRPLATALVKIHMENLSNLNPDGLYSFLKFSHP